MKPPMRKLCGKAHWTYEDHYTGASAINPDYIKEMAAGAMGQEKRIVTFPDLNPPETVTTVSSAVTQGHEVLARMCNTCNKPLHNRGKVCNACRQRAYRERSK